MQLLAKIPGYYASDDETWKEVTLALAYSATLINLSYAYFHIEPPGGHRSIESSFLQWCRRNRQHPSVCIVKNYIIFNVFHVILHWRLSTCDSSSFVGLFRSQFPNRYFHDLVRKPNPHYQNTIAEVPTSSNSSVIQITRAMNTPAQWR